MSVAPRNPIPEMCARAFEESCNIARIKARAMGLTSADMVDLERYMVEACADMWETVAISHARDVLAGQA